MTSRAQDLPTRTDLPPGAPARSRLLVAAAAGAAAGGVTAASGPWALAPWRAGMPPR